MNSSSDRDPPLTSEKLLKQAWRARKQRLEPVSLAQTDSAETRPGGFTRLIFAIILVAVIVVIFLVASGHIHL